jgi:hypothetical protein
MWIISGSKSGNIVRASDKPLVVTEPGYSLHQVTDIPNGFTADNCRDYKYEGDGKVVELSVAEKAALAEAAAARARAAAVAANKAAVETTAKAAELKAAAQAAAKAATQPAAQAPAK